MQSFKEFIMENAPPEGTVNHPLDRMKDESPKGLDWEYDVEYKKYGGERFSPGIRDREHFQELYDNAEVRYLSHDESHGLEYATHSSVLNHPGDKLSKLSLVRDRMGHRRDIDRIHNDMINGKTAYPIVLKNGDRHRILAGDTRENIAAAEGLNLPVKIIEVK